ncbi:YebG family protein [Thalassotalea crassostreae]|uniref:YebG family protein n=1 Tax=Thalassotalea crassostreae TaxID=1763536 RepID=UPI0008381590|nr:YebG family protein [Thalassotalea crassostreae]
MAVESRFVVIRNGVEVETFMDKKAADEYDKMLDMADNLSVLFEQSSIELTESLVEELSVYIAKNREDVLIALGAKKPKVAKVEKADKPESSKEEPVAKAATKKA